MTDPQTKKTGTDTFSFLEVFKDAQEQKKESLDTSKKQERTDVSLSVLEQNVDRQQTIDVLRSIDFNKTYEEQKEKMMLLEDVLWPVIIKGFDADYAIQSLSDTSSIEREKLVNLNRDEQIVALEITKNIAECPESKLASTWPFESFVSEHRSNYETASVMKNFDTKVEPIFSHTTGKPYEESKMRAAWEFTKKHPLLVAFGVTAGYYGVVKPLWRKVKSWFHDPDEEKKKEEKNSSVLRWTAGGVAIGGALALGAMFAPDSFQRFIRDNLHINWSAASVWKFLTTAWKEKDISKAAAAFREGVVEIDTASRAVASHIGADPEKIAFLQKAKYQDFMSNRSQMRTIGKDIGNTVLSKLCPEWDIPFLTDKDELERQVDAEKKLHAFFSDSKIQAAILTMNLGENATVGDILNGLNARGYFGPEATKIAEEEQRESHEKTEEPDIDDYSLIGDSASVRRITEYLKGWGAKETVSVLEKFSRNEYKDSFSTFLWDLAKAIWNDDLTVIKDGDYLTLAKKTTAGGFDFVVLGSFEVLGDTFLDIMRAQYDEDFGVGDVATQYGQEVAGYCVAVGLAKGVLEAFRGWNTGILKGFKSGVVSGTVEGTVLPFTVGKYGFRTAQWAKRAGQEYILHSRGIKELAEQYALAPNDALKNNLFRARLEKLDFYAEIYEKYNRRLNEANESIVEKGFSKAEIAKRTWFKIHRARYETLLIRYEEKFIREWNRICDKNEKFGEKILKIEKEQKLNRIKNEIKHVREKLTELREAKKVESVKKGALEIKEWREKGSWTDLGEKYVKGIDKAVLDDVLRSRGIDPANTTLVNEYLEAWDKAMAEQLYDGKTPDPYFEVNVKGAKPPLRVTIDSKTGKGIATYKGMRVEIPKADMPSDIGTLTGMEKARTFCEIKWTEAARNILRLEVDFDKNTKQFKYSLRGEEYTPTSVETLETIQDRYLDALKKGDKPVPEDFAATIAKHAHWASKAEFFLGTAATVGMILDIEYSHNKQEALVRQLSLLVGALASAKVFDSTIGNKLPYTTRFFANFFVAIIGATLGYEAIQNNKVIQGILDAVEKNVPGVHGISKEVGEIMYKRLGRKMILNPLANSAITKRVLEKPVGAMMDRFAGSALRKSLTKIVTQKTIRNVILKGLGKKAPVVLAMFADDVLAPSVIYAPVALFTDLMGVGLTLWSIYDIYEAYAIHRNAEILQKELAEREKLPIKAGSVSIIQESVLANISKELSEQGLTLEDLETNEKVLFEFLRKEPLVTFEFEREGKPGKERWTMKNGETSKIEIYNAEGKLVASVDEMDASNMEEAMHRIEETNKGALEQDDQKNVSESKGKQRAMDM